MEILLFIPPIAIMLLLATILSLIAKYDRSFYYQMKQDSHIACKVVVAIAKKLGAKHE